MKLTPTDWQADFLSDEGKKSREYLVYFGIRQNHAGNMSARCVRRFIQCFLKSLFHISLVFPTLLNRESHKGFLRFRALLGEKSAHAEI